MNRLENLAEHGIIELFTSEIAQNEMLAGGDSRRADKAYSLIFTMSAITDKREVRRMRQIEQILCPGGASSARQRNDVEIVFNAAKYPWPLITNDGDSKSQPGGILGNRAELAKIGVKILRPAEAVAEVDQAITLRDKSVRHMASVLGLPLPQWVGKD